MIEAALLVKLVNNALEFSTEGLRTYNGAKQRQADTIARHEQLDFSRDEKDKQRAHVREMYLWSRADALRAREHEHRLQLDTEVFRELIKTYPVLGGPGSLRASVLLVNPDRQPIPVLLISPPSPDSDPGWRTLDVRIRSMLMHFQNRSLDFSPQVADRRFSWPDARLFDHDLFDLPVIVLLADVVDGELTVQLGGCNLGGPQRTQGLHQVAYKHVPSLDWFTPERVAILESTSPSGFRRPVGKSDSATAIALQLEWAARIATLAVIIAVDAFHLLARTAYPELTDDALQLLGPDAGVPPRFEPVDLLADPAYHLLHVARRQVRARMTNAASTTVRDALAVLAPECRGHAATRVRAARTSGALQPWHITMLQEIRALPGGSGVITDATIQALTTERRSPEPAPPTIVTPAVPPRRGRPVPLTKRPSVAGSAMGAQP